MATTKRKTKPATPQSTTSDLDSPKLDPGKIGRVKFTKREWKRVLKQEKGKPWILSEPVDSEESRKQAEKFSSILTDNELSRFINKEDEKQRRKAILAEAESAGVDLLCESDFKQGGEYRSVTLRKKNWTLTTMQAAQVKILHEMWLNGTPEVSRDYIMEQIGVENSRLQDSWRGDMDAYRALIRRGKKKSTVTLNL